MSEAGKTYGQACPIAVALDLLGDRWTLLILRDLTHTPLRFGDLQAINPGLSPNLLSTRLRQLENRGIIWRRRLPAPASASVYAVRPQLRAGMLDVLNALGRFGAAAIERAEQAGQEGVRESILRQLRCATRWMEAKRADLEGSFRLEVDGVAVGLRFTGDGVRLVAEPPADPVASITTPAAVMALLANDGITLDQARARGLTVHGDREAALRLIEVMSLR